MSGIIIGGLTTGCLYALVGLGLILIFRTSGALNLAQGATAAAGAFLALGLATGLGPHVPIGLAAAAGQAAAPQHKDGG
jgi:branched-chain amino acid transport system permease protein